jgi:hypothetical protein
VDKPLSQERLSEEDIKRYEEFYDMPNSDGYAVTVKKLLREVKRLQAIETRYKSTLERIRTQAMQGDTAQTAWKVAKWSDEALEGADTNEK